MEKVQSLQDYAKTTLVGKTLKSLQFSLRENEEGEPSAAFGQKIKEVHVGMNESREDAGIWLFMDNGEEIFVYDNENIEVE